MGRMPKYKRMMSIAKAKPEEPYVASQWVANIEKLLSDKFVYDSGKKWTIYRVPTNLLKIHKKAFVPKILSIGPFHYRDPRLMTMDEHKERYLFRLLGGTLSNDGPSIKHHHQPPRRSGDEIEEKAAEIGESSEGGEIAEKVILLHVLKKAMTELMPKARATYSEVLTLSDEQFVQMMVMDGCFVVELLRLFHKSTTENIDDAIFTTRWMLRTLQRDLLMLENQLPFFVLERLYELTKVDAREPPLIELVLEFLNPLLPRRGYQDYYFNSPPEHILDVLLLSFISPMQRELPEGRHRRSYINRGQERQLIHCVTELQDAGVRFKRGENQDILHINFSNGTLEIPQLYINDNTVPIFLNFLAYEQCDQEAEPFFTNYFMFLDGLINSSKDVKILHQYEIINHTLGSKENVANLFNRVCRELVFDLDHCYLSWQMAMVNEYWRDYYATQWRVYWTHLIHDYFSSPWTAMSLAGAILLLILTAMQTVYTAITYYHH